MREAWNSVIGGKEVLIKMGNINELKIRFGIRSYGFWSIGYFTDMGRFWNTVIYDLFSGSFDRTCFWILSFLLNKRRFKG